MRISTPMILSAALCLSACGSEDPPAPKKSVQGREETKNIRGTEAVGYAGNAIANKVDGVLNANDQRVQTLDDKAAASAGEPPPQ